jgi:hypothetical protein
MNKTTLVFRFRIGFNADTDADPAFKANADSDSHPGFFDTQKLEKNLLLKFLYIFINLLIPRPP